MQHSLIEAQKRYLLPASALAGRLAAAGAATWFLVHLAFYVARICHLNPLAVRELCHELGYFFAWQAAGFFALALVAGMVRPALAGGALGGYLIASTVALLAASHNAGLVGRVVLLLLWTFCAVAGMRQLIARAAGPRYATWGVAAAAVFAALVPLCFLLGILHAITPSNVAALAVATAAPGWSWEVWHCFARSSVFCEAAATLLLAKQWHNAIPSGGSAGSASSRPALEAIWMALAITFVGASTCEVRSDAVRAHLPYIHQVVWDHGISHQYACWHRLQPMAMQTCCAAFATVGGDAAAKWFSWLVLAALALLVADEVHHRSGSSALGALAAAAALGCPVLMGLATTVYVDHAMALLCTAGFVVLFRALRPPCLRGILLSAAIMASMTQVKYPGLVFCVVWGAALCAGLLWQCPWRVAVRWSLAGGALLAAAASPWYAYVYAGTGNPFFPYLQNWFHSPYWIDGFSPQQVYEQSFKLDPGIGGILRFPWIATFHTHRFVEGYDGDLGFWVLALLPCWLVVRPRRAGPYWDMALAGVAMVALIVSYTPYIRYWLPAYPLLVAACVLAAAPLIRSAWQHAARACRTEVFAGLALTALLLFPIVLLGQSLSWDEYAGRLSPHNRYASVYRGYQTVEQLNPLLTLDDGVIVTGYEGNHLIEGRAYEFPFWWCNLRRIRNVPSMAEFCRRCHIRYWLVDHSAPMSRFLCGREQIAAHYWTDARLVTACGTTAVYDVTGPSLKLVKSASADLTDGAVAVTGQAGTGYRLRPESPGGLCRVKIDVSSVGATGPLLEIVWRDAQGNVAGHTSACTQGKSDYAACLYSPVPPNARTGRIEVREPGGLPLRLTRAEVTYWRPATAAETARRGENRASPGSDARTVR